MTQGTLFTPTAEQRNQVEVLAGFGLPQHQIAVLLGCDPKTLRKHFETELSVGDAKATAKIAQTLFNKALSGDTASLIFWMKARAGWRERVIQEHTGPDGEGPPSLRIVFVPPRKAALPESGHEQRQPVIDVSRDLFRQPTARTADEDEP